MMGFRGLQRMKQTTAWLKTETLWRTLSEGLSLKGVNGVMATSIREEEVIRRLITHLVLSIQYLSSQNNQLHHVYWGDAF